MTELGRAQFAAVYSSARDVEPVLWETDYTPFDSEPEAYLAATIPVTGGTTVVSGAFPTLQVLAIQNLSDAIDVTVSWEDTDGNINAQRTPPGGLFMVPEVDVTDNTVQVTPDSGTVNVRVAALSTGVFTIIEE